MITAEQREKLEKLAMDACVYQGGDGEPTFDEFVHKKFLEGAEALDRMLSTESACVTGCKNFTGGEIRHHKDCAHYPESFSKMYDELETRIQSESSDSDDDRLRGVPGSGIFLMADDTVGESDEEAAKDYSENEWAEYQEHLSIGGNKIHVRSFVELGFLAGCARYRPIVEEMLAALKRDNWACDSEIIARAEKLLGEKK